MSPADRTDEVRSVLRQAARFAGDARDLLVAGDTAGARSALLIAAEQARHGADLAAELERELDPPAPPGPFGTWTEDERQPRWDGRIRLGEEYRRRVPDTLPPEPAERPWSLDEEIVP